MTSVGSGGEGRIVEEGEKDIIAGRPDDNVDLLAAAIGENHAIAIEPFDRGLHRNIARPGTQKEFAGYGSMAFERADFRFGKAIVAHLADQFADHPPAQPLAQPLWHPGRGRILVERLALIIFGENPDAAAGGNKQLVRHRPL